MRKRRLNQEYSGKIYTLPEMMENLSLFTEEQWGLYAFGREALRGKISHSERIRLALEAAECGRAQACRMKAEKGSLSVEAYVEKLGLSLKKVPKANDGGFVIFAQFKPPCQVILFTDCLEKAGALLKQYGKMPFANVREIEELLLAHELFHYVEEERGKELFTRSYRLPLWNLGPIHYTSSVSCLGEIAGMAFAASFCDVEYSPYMLDVFLVYGYNPQAAFGLYEGIQRVVGQKNKKEDGEL